MSDRVRWGILATGGIAATFVEDLKLLDDAEVVAVGSRTQAAADAFAQRYDIPRAYGDWASLAADRDVDVIYVATPHSAHYSATLLCLEAGKAVLCEKPFTLDAPSSRVLIDSARQAGVFLMEAMWTRCNPTIHQMVQLIGDGAIGEVSAVHADFGIGPLPLDSRLHDLSLGGGALLDVGIYPITLAHLALGRPDSVEAWASLTEAGVDDNTAMIFGYASGAIASLTCGLLGDTGMRATITGQRGRIELPAPFFRPTTLTLHRDGAEPELIGEPLAGHGYVPQALEVHRCLRAGLTESPLVTHAITLEVMSILDDVRQLIGLVYPGESGAVAATVPAQRKASTFPAT
jgi:predicted dehydrogenase